MALIERLERGTKQRHQRHDPVARAVGYVFDLGGARYVQVDSYGRKGRATPDDVSQSFQVDAQGAQELILLLREAFPEIP